MNIGIIIGRIGGVDGVALETEKWIKVLKRMGHEIFILSGKFERDIVERENQTIVHALSFFSKECVWEQQKAFFNPDGDKDFFLEGLDKNAGFIAEKIMRWIKKNNLQMLLSENSSAYPCHLSMGMGIKRAVELSGINIICHDHDFAWERPGRFDTPFKEITEIVESTFPLIVPNSRNAVINTAVKDKFQADFNREAILVPNVMDFNRPFGNKNTYNSTLHKDLGITQKETILLQATRIVRRKRIETAFELIERLDEPDVKLLVTGSHRDDEKGEYFNFLVDQLHKRKLEDKIIFGDSKIENKHHTGHDGTKVYSLSDAYANSIACTYFSDIEGFGNAFVEAVLARKPIFVNNYKPVYWPEIGSKGFKTVMIEDNNLTDAAINDMRDVIRKPGLQADIAEYNFDLGKKHFSYQVLQNKLEELLESFD